MNFYARMAVLAVFTAASISCSKEGVEREIPAGNSPIVINELASGVPGELMIKIRPESGTKASGGLDQALEGTREISAVLAETAPGFKLERLFPECGRFEARTRAEGLDTWYLATFDKSLELTAELVSKLKLCGSVEYIEYSPRMKMYDGDVRPGLPLRLSEAGSSAVTRKERFPFNESSDAWQRQWHYNNTGMVMDRPSLVGADANVWKAWTLCTGSPDVIVAVADQGIMYDHEDLAANMWVNSAEIPDNGIDDDGNGYVDDIYGFNFIDNNNHIFTSEDQAHGTHVAGTIAAVNNNGLGVNGIAGGSGKGDGVRIMCLQSLGQGENGGSGSGIASAVRAVKYAADNGAVICQNSWGYDQQLSWNTWTRSSFSALRRAMDYFIKYAGVDENGNQTGPMKGGILIFASGNQGVSWQSYPAADDMVVAVSASAYNGDAAVYTNYGPWVDITAPGGDLYLDSDYGGVYSTVPGKDGASSYSYMNGTSMACPHVSGACALAVSYYWGENHRKGLTPDKLREALLSSAAPINANLSPAYSGQMGAGQLDTYRLLCYMDYMDGIPAMELSVGQMKELSLEGLFPQTGALSWSLTDSGVVSVSVEDNVMNIKALAPGSCVLKLSDGAYFYKTMDITVSR